MANHRGNSPDPPHEMAELIPDRPGGMGLPEEDQLFLQNDGIKWRGVIVKSMQLGRVTVMCLVFNRMIGTGIFFTPATVFQYSGSVGVSLLWWLVGVTIAMCGILVYMELGLTLPLYKFHGEDEPPESVPRNGGELIYLKYIFQRPRYFAICGFGVAFLLLFNIASNAIAFSLSILDATGHSNIPHQDAITRAIAIGIVTFSCLIHGSWRQGGLYLNNILAGVKLSILVLIFIIGMLAYGGVFPAFKKDEGALHTSASFSGHPADPYGYAEALLAIIYAFGGFNQANYVLGEVNNPRVRYKWPVFIAVGIVSSLYILVNVAYFIVVPAKDFKNGITTEGVTTNVAQTFFRLTLGSLNTSWAPNAPRVMSGFMAISSAGNIIVTTYTASRVKQEIAKEGIVPFRKFFAKGIKSARIPTPWHPRHQTLPEDVPIGGLCLHWVVNLVLILGTWQMTATNTYLLLVDLAGYTMGAIFGSLIGFGLLYLRLFSGGGWASFSQNSGFRINPILSCIAAFVFGIANLYPLAAKWVPPKIATASSLPFWMTGVISWSIFALGVIWWFGFRHVVPRIGKSHVGRCRLITRTLWFTTENGYKILEYEEILTQWPKKEYMDEDPLQEQEVLTSERDTRARLWRDGVGAPDG